jgi:hypothetical protein
MLRPPGPRPGENDRSRQHSRAVDFSGNHDEIVSLRRTISSANAALWADHAARVHPDLAATGWVWSWGSTDRAWAVVMTTLSSCRAAVRFLRFCETPRSVSDARLVRSVWD